MAEGSGFGPTVFGFGVQYQMKVDLTVPTI